LLLLNSIFSVVHAFIEIVLICDTLKRLATGCE